MKLAFDSLDLTLRGREILKTVSGQFQPGKVTVILGANGAGKSSLLSCLAGLREPQGGSVTLDNQPLFSLDNRERGRLIGLLPQRPDIHWNVDVKTIVGLGRLPHSGRWGMSDADHQAVARAMVATDCADLADRKAMRLSGGEQGRVLLARVLAGEPRWLLADEPLASLDPAHQFDVLERLKTYARAGQGVIVVLHDLTQAARFADDVIVLKEGNVLAAGPREQAMTAETMGEAYGVEIQMGTSATGEPLVVPVRRL
ncbi:iron complex transport system ATP-binding protein [Parasphingorhabdus marina DSM 22363]|uniref:Iron complex transport system ATP-binding protein n=1 Tax=Parasphingorhabdus marina DSM 22363 TaxID=1123272 RepID=A0A1N6D0W7_9SPHN|nr:ABC transporter ATP-binding protein [Parasphingorhabdus marina]SIN64369.1 iron complex transport system ATP-binding protein [Parasphingorhabdus marina DSM 22363]